MNVQHEINRESTTTTWLTPISIIRSLGDFDLDPCTPDIMPWETAKKRYTERENGLVQPWFGRVWLNPPYGKLMPAFLKKMAIHGNGIALTFNRTETDQFFQYVWPIADAVLFKRRRIHFLNNEGKKVGNGSGCGSVFIAYGSFNADMLEKSGIEGKFIRLKPNQRNVEAEAGTF